MKNRLRNNEKMLPRDGNWIDSYFKDQMKNLGGVGRDVGAS